MKHLWAIWGSLLIQRGITEEAVYLLVLPSATVIGSAFCGTSSVHYFFHRSQLHLTFVKMGCDREKNLWISFLEIATTNLSLFLPMKEGGRVYEWSLRKPSKCSLFVHFSLTFATFPIFSYLGGTVTIACWSTQSWDTMVLAAHTWTVCQKL